MVKKGTPEEVLNFYNDLLKKVSQDPDWRAYIQKGGADPVFYEEEKFVKIIKNDQQEFTATLKDLGIIK